MKREDFISRYPQVFHMAEGGSWPSIKQHGLLSTKALLDLYETDDVTRQTVTDRVRKKMTYLQREGFPDVAIRDQIPLKFIDERLSPGTTLVEFLDALNTRVFFHASEERLRRLLNARHYRSKPHDVLICDTRILLAGHSEVDLCPWNSGSVHLRSMPRRGPGTFEPLEDYDWEAWRRRRGTRDAVVELTVRDRVNVLPSVLRVERWVDNCLTQTLYEA